MKTTVFSKAKPLITKVIISLSIVIVGILTFLLTEGWIIGLVVLLGAVKAFFVLSIICTCISFAIVYFYNCRQTKAGVLSISHKVQAWIAKKEKSLSPTTLKLARTSKLLALLFSTVTVGPFLTTVAVKLLGYTRWVDYILSLLSSALFSLVWVSIYSGIIAALSRILAQ